MEIFYIDTNEFVLPADILKSYGDRKFLSEEKEKQHCFGRYLVKTAAKDFYQINDPSIEIINKKPRFKNSKLHFSISHTENIVLAAFDKNPVGADIEIMKDRNFKELFKRYNFKGDGISKELFYSFWTEYEAGIKLQGSPKTKITIPFKDNFMLSIAGNFDTDYRIFELTPLGFNCI